MTNTNVHFISLGCPKNLVDSEIMLASLKKEGYTITEKPQKAHVIVINTCGFIQSAKEESLSNILQMSRFKNNGYLQKLVVTGCLVQRYKDELAKELPEVDVFIGSGLFQDISKILKSKKRTFYHLPTHLQTKKDKRVNSQLSHRAYLKISEGCKKRCSFCAIPLIRGNLQSRSLSDVTEEAQTLTSQGVKELIVISHDFTDYGWDLRRSDPKAKESPYTLLKALSENSNASWIRVLYFYPDGITDEILHLYKEKENLVKYFDMPLQHINNKLLKKMNRRMTKENIKHNLKKIRKIIPEAVLRTQFIVGFPGETEDQFQELLEFIEEFQFDHVGCFTYSHEEGTPSSRMTGLINEEVKKYRYETLMDLQRKISSKKCLGRIGKTLSVLVEGVSEQTPWLLQARHSQQAPDIDGLTYINEGFALKGEIVNVQITHAHDYDLVGKTV